MDKYIVAVYVPKLADAVRELMELKDELTKVHGVGVIRTMKRGTPTLETEKGVIQFYSGTQVRRYALFGKSSQSCSTFRLNATHTRLVEKWITQSFTDRFLITFSKKRRSDIYVCIF